MWSKKVIVSWAITAIPIVLVFDARINGILIAALSVFSIYVIVKDKPKFDKTLVVQTIFFSLVVWVSILDLFNDKFDLQYIERSLSALFIPIVFWSLRKYYSVTAILKRIGVAFTIINAGLLLIAIYNSLTSKEIVYGVWSSKVTQDFYEHGVGLVNWGMLTYTQLISYLNIHLAYYGMLVTLVIVVYFYLLKVQKVTQPFGFSAVIINVSFIVLLTSKANIIAMMLVFVLTVGLIYSSLNKIKRTGIIITLAATLLMIFLVPSTRLRIVRSIETILGNETQTDLRIGDDSSTSERVVLWHSAVKLIKEKVFFGHGIVSGNAAIIGDSGIQKNAHNQFLQILINSGILGFILFVAYVIGPLAFSGYDKILVICFVAVVIVNMTFENILERQYGVVIVSFFYSILYSSKKTECVEF